MERMVIIIQKITFSGEQKSEQKKRYEKHTSNQFFNHVSVEQPTN
jgi:uncharacterized membrane protein